jgi:flagellar biosynthesis chaperone FliJ
MLSTDQACLSVACGTDARSYGGGDEQEELSRARIDHKRSTRSKSTMGSFDRRRSWKMKQRRAQAAKKLREKRAKSASQETPAQGETG